MKIEELRKAARNGITIKRCMLCTSHVAPGNELCLAHWAALADEGIPCAHPDCKDKGTERYRGKDFCRLHAARAATEMRFCSHSDCDEKAFHMVDGMDLCDDHFDQYRRNAAQARDDRIMANAMTSDHRECKHCKGTGASDVFSVVHRCAFCIGTGIAKDRA